MQNAERTMQNAERITVTRFDAVIFKHSCIIGAEPAEVSSNEHKIWKNIKNSPAVTLIYPEQSKPSPTFLFPL